MMFHILLSGISSFCHGLNSKPNTDTPRLLTPEHEKELAFIITTKTPDEDGNIDHILFEDESMIHDYQAIQKTWFHKGQQRIIPTYGKHEGVKLLGFLNYETGHIYCEENQKYDAKVFLNFLQNIIKLYPYR